MMNFPFGNRCECEQLLLKLWSEFFSDGFGRGSLEDTIFADRDNHGVTRGIENASLENFESGHIDI
jgi:hypothetical protein